MKIFGIRHHGPGSAKRLQKALSAYQPDCILLELPVEGESAVKNIREKGLKPPVALLLYPAKDLEHASYFPMAEFSPEWQALIYADKQSIPIVAMDLPIGIQIPKQQKNLKKRQLSKDPLGHMAQLAGFSDSERWWDVTFEQEENDLQVFTIIEEMISALREGLLFDEPPFNIAREAHMRKCVRKAVKEGYQKIAVVCGAWHVPAIANWQTIKASADNARLKGLKKVKHLATWIPWNYERLAFSSGYRAGVLSPAWYELLFRYKKTLAIRWLAKVGRLMRKEGLDASPAHTLEAIRLVNNLTALRDKPIIGLDDLKDAAITIFCKGDPTLFGLIERKLIIGDKVGKVPAGITNIPLQRDFEKKIKTARLSKDIATSEAVTKELDLRKDTQLLASRMIHQLGILEINWGRPMKGSRFKKGSFKEKWKLKWSPDYYIKIIEAAIYGNTLEEAAKNKLQEDISSAETLETLATLLEKATKANLLAIIPVLARKMQDLAAVTKDILSLMSAVPNLVQVFKYGNQHGSEVGFLPVLIEEMLIRIFLGLPEISIQLEEDAAKDVFQKIVDTNNAIQLYNKVEFFQRWAYTLQAISQQQGTQMLLRGLCHRLLFDKEELTVEAARQSMVDMLNTSGNALAFAAWLEGFLSGSGLLLIHNEVFWEVVDQWITGLPEATFETLLPVIRRTFSNFSSAERHKMLQLAKHGIQQFEQYENPAIDEARAKPVVEQVELLLK